MLSRSRCCRASGSFRSLTKQSATSSLIEAPAATHPLHEWEKILLAMPSLLLEVVPVGERGASVHLEVDGAPAAEDVGAAASLLSEMLKRELGRERTGR